MDTWIVIALLAVLILQIVIMVWIRNLHNEMQDRFSAQYTLLSGIIHRIASTQSSIKTRLANAKVTQPELDPRPKVEQPYEQQVSRLAPGNPSTPTGGEGAATRVVPVVRKWAGGKKRDTSDS